MNKVVLMLGLMMGIAAPALAVDLSTLFGAPHATATPAPTCVWVVSKTTIVANGSDSVTVSAIDGSGAAITSLATVAVTNGTGVVHFTNISLSKTLTSSVVGQWDVSAVASNGGNCGSFSISAQ